MTVSRVSLSTSRILIGDTCALVNEVFEGTRRATLTSLLAALHHEAVRLYVPRHVLEEVGRHIAADAQARVRPVDPLAAQRRWDTLYAPHIRVVDVPDDWARNDPRVAAVDCRHPTDTPFAQLAVTVGPSWVLTEDPDLIANELGRYDRLPMLHAAANDAEVSMLERTIAVPAVIGTEALKAAGRGLMRLPGWAQLAVGVGAGLVLVQTHRDGRLASGLRQLRGAAASVGRAVIPPVATIMTRRQAGLAVWAEHQIAANPDRSLPEQIAAVLARAPADGLLASQIARHVELDVPQSRLVSMVRDVVRSSAAFTEVSRGRWVLGHPVTARAPEISPPMVAEWLHRSHRHDPVLTSH
ncbi:PIN domain-containing protein [Micromonospora carbonacea]|uniref:hypothetical protein n=1 Tax=Micromonospora carbonacea TaxID=47853 RepID=UPI0037212250